MGANHKPNSKSKYKYVDFFKPKTKSDGAGYFKMNIKGVKKKVFKSEREAALAVDKYLISIGKNPVNILKKKA